VAECLKRDFPELCIVLNGGIRSTNDVVTQLKVFDGVMIGREAYHNPYLLAELHRVTGEAPGEAPSRLQVLEGYLAYVLAQMQEGESLRQLLRPAHGLFANLTGARAWRRLLSELSLRPSVSSAPMLLEMARSWSCGTEAA